MSEITVEMVRKIGCFVNIIEFKILIDFKERLDRVMYQEFWVNVDFKEVMMKNYLGDVLLQMDCC